MRGTESNTSPPGFYDLPAALRRRLRVAWNAERAVWLHLTGHRPLTDEQLDRAARPLSLSRVLELADKAAALES